DLSTVFWFNVATALFLYIIIFVTAPLIAAFYKLELLINIIRVYGISIVIKSFSTVHAIRFVKNLDFKTSFKIQLPSLLISGASGIFFAYIGFGVWALVLYPIIQAMISSVQYWFY